MRKAFTLIELVVAMGILAIILAFAGVIFRVSTDSQRMAMANAEIMQKLRVITSQLDADFKGMIISYGGRAVKSTTTWTVNSTSTTTNCDGVAFFANGDFQSTHQYNGKTIVGNIASLYYGPPEMTTYVAPRERLLLRRQTILAPQAPAAGSRWDGEYYSGSLEEWRINPPYGSDATLWPAAPVVEPNDLETQMPMYLAQGVDNFTIEYLEAETDWGTGAIPWLRPDLDGTLDIEPLAFKMTFTLYDSNGIIKDGRTFTHIVLVGG